MNDLVTYVPHPWAPGETIGRFLDSGIQAQIDKAVASLEPGKHVAVVGYANVHGDLRAAAVYRISDEWSVIGVLEKPPGSPIEGEAAIRWSK